jgi:hypothetical protein
MKAPIFVLVIMAVISVGVASAAGPASASMPVLGGPVVSLSTSTDAALPISHGGFILAKYKFNPSYPTSGLKSKPCFGTNCPAPKCYNDGGHQVCPGDPNKQPVIPGDCVGPQC